MASAFAQSTLGLASHALPNRAQDWLVRWRSQPLVSQLTGKLTDQFIETLLGSMSLAFSLSRDYRRNIQGFRATFVYTTRDGSVACSAVFDNGRMRMHRDALPTWSTRIVFRDADALRSFMLSDEPDSLESILADNVEAEGNLNNVYRIGFLARDLSRRLGVG
jgi:hypothetical protein